MAINYHNHNINTSGTITSPSGNFTTLIVNGTSVSNFNSSVSGLVSGIYAPLSGKLNQFANTSSSELSSIITDETGTGLLVFNSSPTLTGIPLVPTATSGTNTNQIASTAFVRTEVSNLVASAPSTLDTLNELASALGNDSNFSTTITNNLAGKANLSGASFTGAISAPTGNFTSLLFNGSGVSITGHSHTSSDITNFNSSVSGLLPTIANSGDNRILTSTGSSVGINAEANLTFDGTNLGIGTSTPSAKLEIQGSSGVYTRLGTTSSSFYVVHNGTTDTFLYTQEASSLRIGTSATERLRITSDGNLEIKTNAGNISTLFRYNENGGELVHYDDTQAAATLLDQCNNSTRLLELINGSDLLLGLGGSNSTGSIRFMRAGYNEGMRIDSAGNVGIGSTSPSVKLDVYGADAAISVGTSSYGRFQTSGGNAIGYMYGSFAALGDGIHLTYNHYHNAAGTLVISNSGGFTSRITAGYGAVMFATSSAANVAPTERMRITSDGSVGIGTSSPSNRLHVQGGELYKTTTDFVFGTTGSLVTTYHGASTGNTYGAIGALSAGGGAWNNLVLQAGGGNVGIGTTSPATRLHVAGTSSTFNGLLLTTAAAGGGVYASIDIGTYYAGWTNAPPASLRFIDDGNFSTHITFRTKNSGSASSTDTERMRITSGGSVGIGTDNPSYTLHLSKAGNHGLGITSTDTNGAQITLLSGSNSAQLAHSNNVTYLTNFTSGGAIAITQAGAGYISFSTNSNERFRIDSNGNASFGGANVAGGRYLDVVNVDATLNSSSIFRLITRNSTNTGNTTVDFVKYNSGAFYITNWEGPILLAPNGVVKLTINSDGSVVVPDVYGDTVGATNRDLFIDNTGLIGYVSSIRSSKTEINNLDNVSWLKELNPVSYYYRKKDNDGNYTDEPDGNIDYGLIAEDVEVVAPELCFYDIIDDNPELRGVHYSKLITPMLKYIQQLEDRIASLETRLGDNI